MTPCPPLTIILDSTVFGDPPNPQGPLLKQLVEYARQTNSRICVPKVVEKECRNRITEAVNEAHQGFQRSTKSLQKLGANDILVPGLDELRAKVLQLWESLLSELGADVVPTPVISHDEVIDKLHAGARPFIHGGDRREDGYRDYLVWRSAIDAAKVSEEKSAVFVSNDHAFGKNRKAADLAEELKAEAAQSGVTVLWRRDLYRFLATEAQPCLGERKEATALVVEYASSPKFRDFMSVADLSDVSATDVGFDPENYDLRYLDDLTIDEVLEVGSSVLDGLVSINADEWTGRLQFDHIDVRLSQFFPPEDWPAFDDESWISVDVTGFSKRHARVSLVVRLETVLLDVGFSAPDGEVEALSISFESVEDAYPPA